MARYTPERGNPIEAQLKTANGRLVIKLEAESPKELFKRIAAADEIFNAESACGICGSPDIRFTVRTIDSNDFYEMRCKCGAKFAFGQHKTGNGLFPKRRDDTGPLAHGGWSKYNGNADQEGQK